MFKPRKLRLLVLPVGILLALILALLAEIANISILVPLSLLPVIFGLIYVSPLFAYAAAWCYEKALQKNIQGTLVAASYAIGRGRSVSALYCCFAFVWFQQSPLG